MLENMPLEIQAALITAAATIIAALIGIIIKIFKKKDVHRNDPSSVNVFVVPPLNDHSSRPYKLEGSPEQSHNPFELDPNKQEFGKAEYIEGMATILSGSRKLDDIKIKKIK